MLLELTAWMSLSMTGQSRFARSVATEPGSISTQTAIWNPAASNPRSSPPAPEKRLMAVGLALRTEARVSDPELALPPIGYTSGGMKSGDPSYPSPTSPQVSAAMRANRKRDSRPEVALRSLLHRRGLRFRKNLRVRLSELAVVADIVFPRAQLAVFIDGCFWHSCPLHGTQPRQNQPYWRSKLAGNLERDARVNSALTAAGWTVLRIWEHSTTEAAAELVEAAVRERAR